MVKVLDKSNNQEFYLDGILKQNLDIIAPKVFDDWDMLFLVSGVEGAGKSTLAFQVARFLAQERFTLKHICFSPQDFMEKITEDGFLQKGDCLVLDEGFLVNARASMTKLNRTFLSILAECRQKNLFLIIVLPNFFDLDKNLALWRSRGLFYVYHDALQRGFFKYYSYQTKQKLYIFGKKTFNYACVKPDFFGRFTSYMPIDHAEYKKLKLKAFQDRVFDKPDKSDADKEREIKKNLFGMLHERIPEIKLDLLCYGFGVGSSTGDRWLRDYRKSKTVTHDSSASRHEPYNINLKSGKISSNYLEDDGISLEEGVEEYEEQT